MNMENFEKFKEYLERVDSVTYKLKKDAENINGVYDVDFIRSLSFCCLASDYSSIDKLQKDLGDDVVLYLYDNPGREYGDIYIHNDKTVNATHKELTKVSSRDDNEFYDFHESGGLDKLIEEMKEELKGSIFIDLSLPYNI